jgi:hypothetical protein
MLWLLSSRNDARADKAFLFFLLFCHRLRFIVAREKLQRGFKIMENKRICSSLKNRKQNKRGS